MNFQPNITWDGVIALLAIVGGAIAFFVKVGKLEQKVNIMFHWFEETVLSGKEHKANVDKKFYGLGD